MNVFAARERAGHSLSGASGRTLGRTPGRAPGKRGNVSRVLSCWILVLGTVLTLAFGCAKPEKPADWNLGQEGQLMFYFLVQLEAAVSGDTEAFTEAGQKLLELRPEESAFLELAEFSLRRDRLEEARITARKGLELFPASLPLTLIISDSYLQTERNKDASDTLLYFISRNPDNKEAVQELARVYLVGERYAEFDALLKSLPARDMTPYMHYVKARSLLNRNRLEEGERELRTTLKGAPDMVDAWVNLGITLQLTDRHKESLAAFRKGVDLAPDNLGLWLRLVDAQIRAKRPDLAMKTVNDAPPSSAFQTEAAMLFVEARQYSMARTLLLQVRDTPGAPEEVHLYLAAIAMENMRNPSEALRELAAIPPRSPLAERALRWRLQILEETGKPAESLPLAREFAEQNPNSPVFQTIYAQAASMAGDTAGSIAILRAARAKWPGDVQVAFHLASHLENAKEREEALELMEFVITREPRNALALNYIGYTLADEGRELDRARGLLERAVAAAPEDPHIADSMAWVLYRLGEYDEAWTVIKKSISLGGDHAVIWEHYGDIALKTGNIPEARKGYANALKLKPDDPDAVKAKLQGLP